MFFGTLIGTYLVYKGRSLVGPYPVDVLDIPLTTVSTFVLLMSSFLMVLALHALRQDDIPSSGCGPSGWPSSARSSSASRSTSSRTSSTSA
jgi:hypothetical protein